MGFYYFNTRLRHRSRKTSAIFKVKSENFEKIRLILNPTNRQQILVHQKHKKIMLLFCSKGLYLNLKLRGRNGPFVSPPPPPDNGYDVNQNGVKFEHAKTSLQFYYKYSLITRTVT